MSLRRPLVLRHGGTSLRLKSLRRAALEPHRAAGFLALMHEAYPVRPEIDALPAGPQRIVSAGTTPA